MVKAKKAKWRIEENTREGFTRYSIRKYSMGVASVAVLSGFFFLSGISELASDSTTTSKTRNGIKFKFVD